MRRPATWVALGLVLVVGVAAAADALRQKAAEPEADSTTGAPAGTTTQRSPATGLSGVLYYTDEECWLQGVQLPDLEQVGGPEWRHCLFSLAPDARDIEAEGAVWSPAGTRKAIVDRRRIVVEWTNGASHNLAGSAPAFRANGRLTFFSGGAIRELHARCSLPDVRRCLRVVVPREAIELAARQHPNAPDDPTYPFTVTVRETAWLDGDRLVALLTMHVRGVGEDFDLLALFEDGGIIDTIAVFESLSGLRASPDGGYFGVLAQSPVGVLLFDRESRALPLPAVSQVRAFDWSPDEDWIALATPQDVYIDVTERRQFSSPPPLRRLGIVAGDLAWRDVFVSE